MVEYITDKLIENTYLFCVNRISNSEDAKDLSQDILYEAIRAIKTGREFISFYSWYWSMARNKCADYIARRKDSTLPIETAGGVVACIKEPIDELIAQEDISMLNFSISRLAAIHREIIIRFYLKEQPIAQIAHELSVPNGTVKRRLFDAKKNLKERLNNMNNNIGKSSYAPCNVGWFMGYSAQNVNNALEGNKIAQQICLLCRSEAKTVNELADEMGVAPIYLEEIIEKLLRLKLIKSPSKDKYATNCCVFPSRVHGYAEELAGEEYIKNGFNEKITEILLGLKDEITALEFYGNDFDYKYLMWILYVIAGSAVSNMGVEAYIKRFGGKYKNDAERNYRITILYDSPDEAYDFPQHENKSVCWSNLHQSFETSDYGRLEYANLFEMQPFPVDLDEGDSGYINGRDKWIDSSNISLLLDLAKYPQKELTEHEQAMAAQFIKNGVIEKISGGLKVMLPIFSEKTRRRIVTIVSNALKDVADEFQKVVSEKVERVLLPYVRKDQLSNFYYWDMMQFFSPINYLFYYGMNESQSLAIPKDYSRSAAGLYVAVLD